MSAPDVVIAGGGVIGRMVAWQAARRGLRVTVLDHPRPGTASLASAGGLWAVGESLGLGCGIILHKRALAAGLPPPPALPSAFVDFAARSLALFPALADELTAESGIDIEVQPTPLLFLLFDAADVAYADALPRHPRVSRMSTREVLADMPAVAPEVLGAVRVDGDHQVHPIKLLHALAAACATRGVTTLPARLTGLDVQDGCVRSARTDHSTLPCGEFVNAAGSWAAEVAHMAGCVLPVRPIRGQIVCTEALAPLLAAGLSTAEVYLLQKRHGEVLIGSTTEDVGFDSGVTAEALRALCAGAARAIPQLGAARVKRAWSGFRPATPDGLPILGPTAEVRGYWNACGHFRTGIVTSALTGEVLAARIVGAPSPVDLTPFLADRFRPRE